MLRLLVGALVLANALFYGWSQGWLDQVVGVNSEGDREPGRLALQVEPQRVRVLGPDGGAPSPSADATAACTEIGPFSPSQLAAAEATLQGALPQNRIENVKRETPAVWIVFMGPYPDGEVRQKKSDELTRLRIPFEEIRQVPELGDGLSLGRFANRNAADKAVLDLATRGVHTARVAQYAAPLVTYTLRVPEATAAQRAQLSGLQSPGLAGKGFAACVR